MGGNQQLALQGKVTPTSWEPPASMTFDQWSEEGRKLQFMSNTINWWIGDWLNEGEKRYGETYAQAIEATGHKLEQLKNCKWVANAVKTSTRVDVLSWTHHRLVAELDPDAQTALLTFAAERELSSRELQEAVQDYERNLSAPALPEPDDDPIPHVAHNSGNNEWYTPAPYIEAARAVMESIELDPASSDEANAIVGAEQIYTKEDNGLDQPWYGRVWMNPPYATDLIGEFADKLATDFACGDVTEAIVLVNNATETIWFSTLVEQAAAIVFPRGRVRFWQPSGETGAPLQGQALIYLGKQPDKFRSEFAHFGWSASL
jgi:phage N-6-adenine-methyltransferase